MKAVNYWRILGAHGWYSDYLPTYVEAVALLAERMEMLEGNLRVKFNGKPLGKEDLETMFSDAQVILGFKRLCEKLGVSPESLVKKFLGGSGGPV